MIHNRKSPRKKGYDYTSPWWYFVTICTKNREHYFGKVEHGQMILSQLWKICEQKIQKLSQRRSVDVHERIVMPNHIHIILIIDKYTIVGADHQSAIDHQSILGDLTNRPYDGPTLSSIIKLLKWNISKMAQQNNLIFWWQRSFNDHIIRNENEYKRIKYYIQSNPANRKNDSLY